MNQAETEMFAIIGKKQIEMDIARTAFSEINVEYDRLMLLLSKVVSGEIPCSEVTVDLAGRRWTLTPATPSETVVLPDEVPPKVSDEPGQEPAE